MVSLLTALTIQSNDCFVEVYGNSNKYGFFISSNVNDRYHTHISSNPVYGTEKIAEEKGKGVLGIINELDLSGNKKRL